MFYFIDDAIRGDLRLGGANNSRAPPIINVLWQLPFKYVKSSHLNSCLHGRKLLVKIFYPMLWCLWRITDSWTKSLANATYFSIYISNLILNYLNKYVCHEKVERSPFNAKLPIHQNMLNIPFYTHEVFYHLNNDVNKIINSLNLN